MTRVLDIGFDLLVLVVLFVLVGGVSHRAGGTCEQRHPHVNEAQARSRPAP